MLQYAYGNDFGVKAETTFSSVTIKEHWKKIFFFLQKAGVFKFNF